MKKTIVTLIVLIVLVIIIYSVSSYVGNSLGNSPSNFTSTPQQNILVKVNPITHATAVLSWLGTTIYTDPVAPLNAFEGNLPPNIILITDIHPDHLSTSTLNTIVASSSTLIVPQAVMNMLPANLAKQARVIANGDTITEQGFQIAAVPMYNIPESSSAFHTKGRGNGYVIEKDNFRVYVAGDTSNTPEMDALQNINLAFIPMNLPYTMSVEEAAQAVLTFKPKIVYPYHYRGQDGLSDINKFKQLVNASDPSIQVVLANWYPTM